MAVAPTSGGTRRTAQPPVIGLTASALSAEAFQEEEEDALPSEPDLLALNRSARATSRLLMWWIRAWMFTATTGMDRVSPPRSLP